jgi:hypothetical protein
MSLATEITSEKDQRFICWELSRARDPVKMADDLLYLFQRFSALEGEEADDVRAVDATSEQKQEAVCARCCARD